MDEKWFYAHPGGSLLYLPPGVQPPVLRVKHKRHIPKVMFLAALGQPTANFNGSVGIWPVQKLYTPKRASRAHPRENNQLVPYLKECVMDGEVFVRMIKEDYIPKVVELGSVMLQAKPVGAKLTVWSQLDNAGGHGLGFTLEEINRLGATCHPHIRIHFYTQPPNSPDMNILDLGAWNSLQRAVKPVVYQHQTPHATNQSQIISAVTTSFIEWNAREKCEKLFDTLQAFMAELLLSGGDNQDQPHKRNIAPHLETARAMAFPNFPALPPPPAPPLPVRIRINRSLLVNLP